jgi:hypothetical protein
MFQFYKDPESTHLTAVYMLCLVNRVKVAFNPLNDRIYGTSVQKFSEFFFSCEAISIIIAISVTYLCFTSSLRISLISREIVLPQHAAYIHHDRFRHSGSVTTGWAMQGSAVQRTA